MDDSLLPVLVEPEGSHRTITTCLCKDTEPFDHLLPVVAEPKVEAAVAKRCERDPSPGDRTAAFFWISAELPPSQPVAVIELRTVVLDPSEELGELVRDRHSWRQHRLQLFDEHGHEPTVVR